MGKEAGSDGPSTTKGGGDSCLDSGELAQLEISGEMVQLEMVKGSPPTVKSGLLEGERRVAFLMGNKGSGIRGRCGDHFKNNADNC